MHHFPAVHRGLPLMPTKAMADPGLILPERFVSTLMLRTQQELIPVPLGHGTNPIFTGWGTGQLTEKDCTGT